MKFLSHLLFSVVCFFAGMVLGFLLAQKGMTPVQQYYTAKD